MSPAALIDAVQSQVGRVVAFILTPILLPVAAIVATWLQDFAGIDLSGGQLTGYVIAVIAGVAITAVRWLANRGEYERAVIAVEKLHDAGVPRA